MVSYTVRNSSRRLLVLLARRSIEGQSLQDGPSTALRRGRVLAGDQIAIDDHMWRRASSSAKSMSISGTSTKEGSCMAVRCLRSPMISAEPSQD